MLPGLYCYYWLCHLKFCLLILIRVHKNISSSHHTTLIWARVPMVCSRTLRQKSEENDDDEEAWNEPWYWWSKFHERMEWDKHIGVVLELSADLPSEELLKRWLGEPVKALIIPTSVFHFNRKGFVTLN